MSPLMNVIHLCCIISPSAVPGVRGRFIGGQGLWRSVSKLQVECTELRVLFKCRRVLGEIWKARDRSRENEMLFYGGEKIWAIVRWYGDSYCVMSSPIQWKSVKYTHTQNKSCRYNVGKSANKINKWINKNILQRCCSAVNLPLPDVIYFSYLIHLSDSDHQKY